MNRSDILHEANRIITQDREDTHGNAEDNFNAISLLWSDYLQYEITPDDVGAMMILLKLIRFKNNPHHIDNSIDIAGYAAILGELNDLNNRVE
jgi:hypothetical protein